jgi:hypothetical protein
LKKAVADYSKEYAMAFHHELKGHRDLKVFRLAYKLAMEIFNESKSLVWQQT